jgi:hypothetical protein
LQSILPAIAASLLTGLAAAQTPPPARPTATPRPAAPAARPPAVAATRPGVVTPANHAAAMDHFDKAKDLLYRDNNPRQAALENDEALKLDPSLVEAQTLRRIIQTRATGAEDETPAAGTAAGATRVKPLTPRQISVVRLLESRPEDQLRGLVPRKVLQDFWDSVVRKDPLADTSTTAYQAFLNPNNFAQQASRIRDSGNLKFIEQVTMNSDPANLVAFRSTVHTYMLQNCATAECHGGEKAGNFRLLVGPGNDPTVYTNFYIMSMYNEKGAGKMIDRDSPDRSLFLQYSLPRNVAQLAHPKIELRKLSSTNEPRYRTMSDWVRGLNIPRPTYGFEYELPAGATSGDAPASAPATRAH